jgi:hypothetical protein
MLSLHPRASHIYNKHVYIRERVRRRLGDLGSRQRRVRARHNLPLRWHRNDLWWTVHWRTRCHLQWTRAQSEVSVCVCICAHAHVYEYTRWLFFIPIHSLCGRERGLNLRWVYECVRMNVNTYMYVCCIFIELEMVLHVMWWNAYVYMCMCVYAYLYVCMRDCVVFIILLWTIVYKILALLINTHTHTHTH